MEPDPAPPEAQEAVEPVSRPLVRRRHAAAHEASDGDDSADELRDALDRVHALEAELQRRSTLLMLTRSRAQAEHQRYVELFESTPDGYLVTDGEGKIVE